MLSSWFYLPTSLEGKRDLLSRCSFADDEYALQVTDLNRVWSASLSKDEIIQQAQDEECPVDPSQDENQFSVLITNLESGLRGTYGAAGSIEASEQDGELVLTTDCPLPCPLPPLEWTWTLKPMDQSAIQEHFIMPLVASNVVQSRRIDKLSETLTEKDSVIGKILDRLDSAGVDLTSIFPQTADAKAGKKGNKRLQLIRQVPAFRPYNKQHFLEASQGSTEDSKASREDVFNTALKDTSTRVVNNLVDQLRTTTTPAAAQADPSGHHSPPADTARREASRNPYRGEEFERQPAAPNVQSKRPDFHSQAKVEDSNPIPTGFNDDDDTTEDEVADKPQSAAPRVEDAASREPSNAKADEPPSIQASGRRPAKKKLGVIGGKKEKEIHQEDEVSLQNDTVPLSEAERPTSSQYPQSLPERMAGSGAEPPKSKPKLGRIGGKAQKKASPMPEPASVSAVPDTSSKPKGSKLGRIGGKKSQVNAPETSEEAPKRDDAQTPDGDDDEGPKDNDTAASSVERTTHDGSRKRNASTEAPASPKPRETSKERADRKREELKQELEIKSKAQAKNKRRKF